MADRIPPNVARNIEKLAHTAAMAVWAGMTPWQKLRAIIRSFFR